MARLLAQKLQELWGQQVIVEYKPGAATVVGTDYVAKSAPDGYTIGMVATPHVINPSLRSNLPYDTLRDLAGVSLNTSAHIVISASPSLEASNLPEVIALAKKQPGRLSYATAGAGTAMHLAGELLKSTAGIDIMHVAYKGSGPAYPDVIAGRVQLMIDVLYSATSYFRSGRLKPIAVASPGRAAGAPEIPAIAETLPGFRVQSIQGVVVPAATPRALIQKLSADFVSVLRSADVRARLAEIGLEPEGTTPEQFDAVIRTEIEKWARVVKSSGARVD